MISFQLFKGSKDKNHVNVIKIKRPLIPPKKKPRDLFVHWVLLEINAIWNIFVKILETIRKVEKITMNEIKKDKDWSTVIVLHIFSDKLGEKLIVITDDMVSPIRRPNSSIIPFLKPFTPTIKIKKTTNKSKNHDI